MKSILIITSGYPTDNDPDYAFIQPIAQCFADSGLSCTVIAPQSLTKIILHQKKRRAYKWYDITKKGNSITIFQPLYVSVSNIHIGQYQISALLKKLAVNRCHRKEKVDADVYYAHFWECGVIASAISKKKVAPLFVASGESQINVYECFSKRRIMDALPFISGVICVSSKNLIESKNLGLLSENTKTVVIPNGYNPSEFYPKEKNLIREKLGIALDEFVAIFVGEFCERKGPDRLIEAVKYISKCKLIMIGWGNEIKESKQIIFQGRIPHDRLVDYLNAADVFVLPTLAEGCCNAIVEALACGLPIISSDRRFNYDVLNNDNAILVDPLNIDEIARAIRLVAENPELRNKMARSALETAKGLTIGQRVKKINDFIEDTVWPGE